MHEYADPYVFAVDTSAPELPADVAAMVAPSITVSAGPAGVDVTVDAGAGAAPARPRVELLLYRANMPAAAPPGGRHRRRAS